ncbi:hypothetical protein B0H14DRAFT_2581228 [Mycena olivaceomarginata]|nr:hypothetical protein B0H14DRAFT_2581228 [Mycena olivaceomarginata]
MASHVLVLFQRLRWHPLQLAEPPPAIFPAKRGPGKVLIKHEDNTFYQNTAEHPQKARDVPLRGRKELVEAPVLPPIVLYKTRDVLLGGYQIIVGGTCIIFSGLVSADGVEEEVWVHPRIGTEISGGACFTSSMVVGKLGAC